MSIRETTTRYPAGYSNALHRLRDFPDLLGAVDSGSRMLFAQRVQRMSGVPADIMGEVYTLGCGMAYRMGHVEDLFKYAHLFLGLKLPSEKNCEIADIVGNFTREIKEELKDQTSAQLMDFHRKNFSNPETLARMGDNELICWRDTYLAIGQLSPNHFISFAKEITRRNMPHQGSNYTHLLQARIHQTEITGHADMAVRQEAEALAEIISNRDKELVRNHQKGLITILIILNYFQMFDLAERLLDKFGIEQGNPCFDIYDVFKTLQQDFPSGDKKHEELLLNTKVSAKYRDFISDIADTLTSIYGRSKYNYLEKRRERLGLPKIGDSPLCIKREEAPDIARKMEKLKRKIWARLMESKALKGHGRLRLLGFPTLFRDQVFDGVLYSPEENAIVAYIPFGELEEDPDSQLFKVKFTVNRDSHRFITGISNTPIFDGYEQRSFPAPLLYEMNALARLADITEGADTPAEERIIPQLQQLQKQVNELAEQKALRNNRENYLETKRKFSQIPEFETAKLQVDNRLKLCQSIIIRHELGIEAEEYFLSLLDLLYPLVEKVSIMGPRTSRLQQDRTINFPLRFLILLRSGKPLMGRMLDHENVQIDGIKHEENSLLEKYLTELILETLIKKQFPEAIRERRPGRNNEAGRSEDPFSPQNERRAMQTLSHVHRTLFYGHLRGKGLLAFPWFVEETRVVDGKPCVLYVPIEDQTIDGRSFAYDEIKPENLFIQIDEFGARMKLPGMPVLRAGHWGVATKRRHELRELQQQLLGDTTPLPDNHSLYAIIRLSTGEPLLYLFGLKDSEAEILSDEMMARAEEYTRPGGILWDIREVARILRQTDRQDQDELIRGLEDGSVTIEGITYDFTVTQTTFKRPHLERLSDLIADNYTLEAQASLLENVAPIDSAAESEIGSSLQGQTPNGITLSPYEEQDPRHWASAAERETDHLKREALLERAEVAHVNLVNGMARALRQNGIVPQTDKSGHTVDLTAERGRVGFVFEMKSITARNVHTQSNKAFGQLCGYSYRLRNGEWRDREIIKVAVFEHRPTRWPKHSWIKGWYHEAGIHMVWMENGKFHCYPESAEVLKELF